MFVPSSNLLGRYGNWGETMRSAIGRKAVAALAWGATLGLTGCGGGNDNSAIGGNEPANPVTPRGWELVWSDEFSGSALDSGKWNIQTGDGTAEGIPGWGNNELQTYQAANVAVSGGNLVITAREEAVGRHAYTSGRINTSGKMDMRYGRVEASIRAPAGQGMWAAFWMLPTDSPYGGWAASGEIDILEVFRRDPSPFTQGTVHFGMAWPLTVYSFTRYSDVDPADGFHTYALEWDEDELRWFVDGVHFKTVTSATYWTYYRDPETNAYAAGPAGAPFDQPFHLLLNLAVGGNLPGDPSPSAFPGRLLVDYVRVYRCNLPGDADCAGFADLVDPAVVAAEAGQVYRATYDLYTNAIGPLAFPNSETTLPLDFGVYDNNGALALSEVDVGGERGMVVDVDTSGGGNFSIHAADLSRQIFFGMGSAREPGDYAGEVQFDLYVFADGTDAESGLQVKLDSGFPDLGFVELAFADLPMDEWTTVSVGITDIIRNPGDFGGGPLDVGRVLSLFVLEPTGAAHLQVDNIRIRCGHPTDRGCGIRPPSGTAGPRPVFIDEVHPRWDNGILGADSGSGWASYAENDNPSNKAQWRIINAVDPARGNIIEVTFTDGDAFGVWFIQASTGVDMADYAAGVVSFDIKVDSYGANAEGMTMKIDCVFPCTSGDQLIGKVGDGEWETVRVPVTRLLSGGLNLATVNTGIVLFPTDQTVALTFQLDNIEWLGADEGGTPAQPLPLYADAPADGWGLWDCCGGATLAEVQEDEERGSVFELSFGDVPTVAGLQAAASVDAGRYREGTLEFAFREVAPPQEGAVWRLKVESENAATAVDIPMTAGGNPPPSGEWQNYRFGLNAELAAVDLSRLKLVLFFPDWGQADGAVGRVDNVYLMPPRPTEIVLYDNALSSNWYLWDCCDGANFAEVDDDEDHGKAVELTFHDGATVTGFQAVEGVDASALGNAVLEFEFKEVVPPPTGSQWRVKLESSGAATAAEVLITASGNPSPAAVWQRYRFDLAADFPALDATDLNLVLIFPDWGNAAGAVARIDNMRLARGS